MKSKTVLFLLLIAMGFIVVVYEGISSTTCKKAADRDPIQVTVEKFRNSKIADGTGTANTITLPATATTITTLTDCAAGAHVPAGVNIDPAIQARQFGGIFNASNANALNSGNGINSGHRHENHDSSMPSAGSGTMVLTAATTYTGTTAIQGGTLLGNDF